MTTPMEVAVAVDMPIEGIKPFPVQRGIARPDMLCFFGSVLDLLKADKQLDSLSLVVERRCAVNAREKKGKEKQEGSKKKLG